MELVTGDGEGDMENLYQRANERIELAEGLKMAMMEYKEVPGHSIIERKIQQEIKFLQKAISNKTLKENNLISSNLVHYDFLIKTLRLQRGVVHIDCAFPLNSRDNPLRVDIVCNNGLKWVKVIARNCKSIEDAAKGCASFGARSVLDQAGDYLEASELHLCMFQRPKIVFYFSNIIHSSLHKELMEMGVQTASITDTPDKDLDELYNLPNELNLDVTTMLAYVSAVTNGRANWVYKEPLLTEQAQKERDSPLKPVLEKMFEGKNLLCCQQAFNAFQSILTLLAGPTELQRAEQFLKRVQVCPDVEEVPAELSSIRFTAKVNERSLKIFSFGMERKIFTVTSNKAFVRSAKMQGIDVPVFLHASRALTENKEATGTPL
ncbi:UPF0415 protein C7orf25 homolog [Scaptodrosophila lebanonensis]|uniref:UPF0415 protein C7orf25 homolog n=1 Tax=Drosophila lebanonensis TaxID=7225 RepID=A0A6J2TRL6_DROLE|nr:UPF0415 protein C7orf25 homolog [Scaptodrosophila lebanonensis]